jgi:hypothetical protein
MTMSANQNRLQRAIGDRTPLYAAVGAGDLAVETIRAARQKLDGTSLREAQAKVTARVNAVQADVRSAPQQFLDLPVRFQAALADVVSTALSGTVTTYAELAGRGRTVISGVPTQPTGSQVRGEATPREGTDGVVETADETERSTESPAKDVVD